jgi:hypothetical protein
MDGRWLKLNVCGKWNMLKESGKSVGVAETDGDEIVDGVLEELYCNMSMKMLNRF